MGKSLIAFDTNKIKNYVFATGTLKEIRGASALLDRLNRVDMPRLAGGKTIYANGGAGLFVVDTDGDEVIKTVGKAYRDQTLTASITGAMVALPEDESNVQAQLETLRYRLRAKKDGFRSFELPVSHPLLHPCDSCGTQYATDYVDGEMLCSSCQKKRQEDARVKADIRRWTSGTAKPDTQRLWGRLIRQLGNLGYPITDHDRPEDFDTLGEVSSPKGYMALIYADGDGMGREIEAITDLQEMNRFADAVDGALYQSVSEAIAAHLVPQGKTWPFDILLLGGDDLVMVTQAQSGIEVALHIVERFPALTENWLGKRLNLSATVVLAHIKYPIGPLLQLAESSLKFAKKEAVRRRLAGETLDGGLLNFLVVSSANHLDFDEYYRQVLKSEENRGQTVLYRTQRPYTAAGMADLVAQIRKVRSRVPRAKLEQLRAAVFQSRMQGTLDAMMAVLRLRRNDEQRKTLLELVGTGLNEQIYLPWIKRGKNDWTTPVLDIVELLDFIGKEAA